MEESRRVSTSLLDLRQGVVGDGVETVSRERVWGGSVLPSRVSVKDVIVVHKWDTCPCAEGDIPGFGWGVTARLPYWWVSRWVFDQESVHEGDCCDKISFRSMLGLDAQLGRSRYGCWK